MPRTSGHGGRIPRDAFLRWYDADKAEGKSVADFSLMAVIAGNPGAALFKGNDGKSLAARTGEDIHPGTRLISVEPTQATIERSGHRQVLKLPLTATAANALAPLAVLENGGGASQSGQKTLSVTHGQLLAALQGRDLDAWDTGLSARTDGGIRIDKSSGQPFARLLQLKDGDILKSVNGRALNKVADISLLAHAFGQQPVVSIALIRHGALLTQRYDIQP